MMEQSSTADLVVKHMVVILSTLDICVDEVATDADCWYDRGNGRCC